jgi:hypothetical protein
MKSSIESERPEIKIVNNKEVKENPVKEKEGSNNNEDA